MSELKEPMDFDLSPMGADNREIETVNFGDSDKPRLEYKEKTYEEYYEMIKKFLEAWFFQQKALDQYAKTFKSIEDSKGYGGFDEIDIDKTKVLNDIAQRYQNLGLVADKAKKELYHELPMSSWVQPFYLFEWLDLGRKCTKVFSGRYDKKIVDAFCEGKEYRPFGTRYDDLQAYGFGVELKDGKIRLVKKITRERNSKDEEWKEVDKTEIIEERDAINIENSN